MANTIKIDDLSNELLKIAGEIDREVEKNLANEIKKIAIETVESLKNDSNIPQRTNGEKSYKRLFYAKKTETGYIIANKKYQLTHLLENGHQTANGGRTRAFPHWSTAQKKVDDAVKEINDKLIGGNNDI